VEVNDPKLVAPTVKKWKELAETDAIFTNQATTWFNGQETWQNVEKYCQETHGMNKKNEHLLIQAHRGGKDSFYETHDLRKYNHRRNTHHSVWYAEVSKPKGSYAEANHLREAQGRPILAKDRMTLVDADSVHTIKAYAGEKARGMNVTESMLEPYKPRGHREWAQEELDAVRGGSKKDVGDADRLTPVYQKQTPPGIRVA